MQWPLKGACCLPGPPMFCPLLHGVSGIAWLHMQQGARTLAIRSDSTVFPSVSLTSASSKEQQMRMVEGQALGLASFIAGYEEQKRLIEDCLLLPLLRPEVYEGVTKVSFA